MKLLELLKSKKIVGVVAACVVLIAAMLVINFGGNQADSPIADTQPVETEKLETIATRKVTTRNSRNSQISKTEPPATQESGAETQSADLPVVDVTLAPVEVPDESVVAMLEENDVQVVPSTEAVQTTPPKAEQRKPDTTTFIDGQKHVWHPDFGWCPDYGEGQVIVMDVEDDGRRYEGGW